MVAFLLLAQVLLAQAAPARAAVDVIEALTAPELLSRAESLPPGRLYQPASRLFRGARRDEAIRWLSVAQIRDRHRLATSPELQEVRNAADRIKGYTGTHTISFRTTPDQLPMLLAGSLDNGAASLSQSGSVSRGELVSRAAKSAMARAQAAAAALGQRVVGVERMEIDPQAGLGAEPTQAARVLERPVPAAAPPPIATEAGQTVVTSTVLLTVRLAPVE